jgi:hypothetical protein
MLGKPEKFVRLFINKTEILTKKNIHQYAVRRRSKIPMRAKLPYTKFQ